MNILVLSKNGSLYLLAGINRAIKASHVTEIAKSVMLMGCCRPIIVAKIKFIDGIERLYIIDGQHLYLVLQRLNLPIVYKLITVDSYQDLVEKLALFNATSKSWTMQDYIQVWTSVNDDYKTLNTFYNTYDIELSILASIMMDLEITNQLGTGAGLKHIKRGTFQIVNQSRAKIILDYLTDVFKIIKRLDRQQNRFVCAEFVKMFRMNQSSYCHKRFIKNLENNKDKFIMATHEPDSLSMIFRTLI